MTGALKQWRTSWEDVCGTPAFMPPEVYNLDKYPDWEAYLTLNQPYHQTMVSPSGRRVVVRVLTRIAWLRKNQGPKYTDTLASFETMEMNAMFSEKGLLYRKVYHVDARGVDVFGVGVILFEMLLSQKGMPGPHQSGQAIWQLARQAHDSCSDEVLSLLRGMLHPDHDTRFSFEDVKRHPWFNLPLPDRKDVEADLLRRQQFMQGNGRQIQTGRKLSSPTISGTG